VADGYTSLDVSSPSLLRESSKLVQDYMTQNQRPMNHMRDFLNCLRTRRPPVAHPEVAHRSMTTCHAANICMLLKRNLKWDPANEKFINDPQANRLRSRAMREPWII
jgi:hypothetical protein